MPGHPIENGGANKRDPLDDIARDNLHFRERQDYSSARMAGNLPGAKNILAIGIAAAVKSNRLTRERGTDICKEIGVTLDHAMELSKTLTI